MSALSAGSYTWLLSLSGLAICDYVPSIVIEKLFSKTYLRSKMIFLPSEEFFLLLTGNLGAPTLLGIFNRLSGPRMF